MRENRKPVVRTVLTGSLIVLLAAAIVTANTLLPAYESASGGYSGSTGEATLIYPDSYDESLDLEYNKADYTEEEMAEVEKALNEEIVGEGIVLLKNDGGLPYAKGTTFSFFSVESVTLMGNSFYSYLAAHADLLETYGDLLEDYGLSAEPGNMLKSTFEETGFNVNETLWDFYFSGNGSSYRLGSGSISSGDSEDFSINECPLSVLESESGLLESAEGTVPVFVWKRNVGEGRDMPRSMYNHADNPEDQAKSYLEPDSTELEILTYLNDNFDDIVLLVNASAAMELGWTEQFEHITSIIYMPSAGTDGLYSLAKIFSGEVNPSGHVTDTFAYDASSAPAAENYGDYQYSDENGELTKYNYVYYQEGIYVGYRYYETRYEDVVMGTGNAGDYDYASTVKYPFGYGLSYTIFAWSNYQTSWDGDTCTVTVDVQNTGSVAGKDVVQVYAQSPYTDYDKENGVEKASVILVGYGKTDSLEPGESETVTVTFEKSQLKSYDSNGAETYILDAGDYYITAGTDAHSALNNVLAAKGYTVADGMTADGDASFVSVWTNDVLDTETYSVSEATGVEITNQFDFASGDITYLTRSDWTGTYPEHQGTVSTQVSTWGNEINGEDGVSYTYTKTISAEDLAQLDSFDSLTTVDSSTLTDTPVYGADNGLDLVSLRGLDYDDPLWDDLLDELTADDYQTIITQSGYGTAELESIVKPYAYDLDAATGLLGVMGGGTGYTYQGSIVLAMTWNQELAEEYGVMIGNQSFFGGANCCGWYAPAMNIHRLAYSGRNNEYYSEDGFLSGVVASKTAKGAASKGMYIFIKHFVLNDQENHRGDREGQYSIATFANEQSIREIYLLPFEMCVTCGDVELNYLESDGNGGYVNATTTVPAVNAIMTSFNRIGYTWAGGCYPLLTNVLRDEWGFEGFVITDNANTGLFMDAGQMIEAGGDAKLTNQAESARWTFDSTDSAQYHYAREALHHVLYTVVNSKAMNGLMPGTKYTSPVTIATKLQIAITAVAAVLILLLGWVIWHGWSKYRKQSGAAKQ